MPLLRLPEVWPHGRMWVLDMNAAVERIREQIAYHETFSASAYIEVPFESLHILLDAYDREHETANELRNLVARVAQIVLPAGDEAGA